MPPSFHGGAAKVAETLKSQNIFVRCATQRGVVAPGFAIGSLLSPQVSRLRMLGSFSKLVPDRLVRNDFLGWSFFFSYALNQNSTEPPCRRKMRTNDIWGNFQAGKSHSINHGHTPEYNYKLVFIWIILF